MSAVWRPGVCAMEAPCRRTGVSQPSERASTLENPVRIRVSDDAGMTDGRMTRVAAGLAKRPYGGRQDLYCFLRANMAELSAIFEELKPSWRTVAEELTNAGIIGASGDPPTRESARKSWQRVCRDVEAERAKRAPAAPPSAGTRPRAPSDWRPPAFAQPNAPSPVGGEHQGSKPAALPAAPLPQQQPAPPPSAGAPQDTSRPVPGTAAAIREMLNLRSGRKANGEPLF